MDQDLRPLPFLIVAWWDAGHDQFPWRETDDPYAIWVSEVMLQQTQVATVLRYYPRWMERFPTIETLASASQDEVLKVWEGLGYYSRARYLHQAAGQVLEQFGGKLPADPTLLQSLPGIGPYTAGAIVSIAYAQPAAVLDGNVVRVLARLTDLSADVTQAATKKQLWALAETLVPSNRPGDYNQALMELGRKVCRPERPSCHECPLDELCKARKRGTQLERPVRPPRKRIPHYAVTAGVIWRGEEFLIAQRPPEGMLGGLWEFPGGKQQGNESLGECLKREIREELGLEIEVGSLLVAVKHAYTHFRITLHAFNCRYLGGEPRPIAVADYDWVTLDEVERYAFPVSDQKIIAALAKTGKRS